MNDIEILENDIEILEEDIEILVKHLQKEKDEVQRLLAEVKKIRGLIKNTLTYIECIPRTSDTVKLKFLIDDLRRYVLREGDEEE